MESRLKDGTFDTAHASSAATLARNRIDKHQELCSKPRGQRTSLGVFNNEKGLKEATRKAERANSAALDNIKKLLFDKYRDWLNGKKKSGESTTTTNQCNLDNAVDKDNEPNDNNLGEKTSEVHSDDSDGKNDNKNDLSLDGDKSVGECKVPFLPKTDSVHPNRLERWYKLKTFPWLQLIAEWEKPMTKDDLLSARCDGDKFAVARLEKDGTWLPVILELKVSNWAVLDQLGNQIGSEPRNNPSDHWNVRFCHPSMEVGEKALKKVFEYEDEKDCCMRCTLTSTCRTNKCPCFKADRKCGPMCHDSTHSVKCSRCE